MNPSVTSGSGSAGTVAKRVGYVIGVIVAIVCLYALFSAVRATMHTGVLSVSSPAKQAGLTISQSGHNAMYIGRGSARVRLTPGVYLVSATNNGQEATVAAQVTLKRTTTVSVNPANAVTLPTASDIDFEGTDALVNKGLTTTQVNNLEEAFFRFKPKAHSVVIDTGSIAWLPHDPNSASMLFGNTFTVTVDSVPYNAKITYADLVNVELYLYNQQTGAQVFDSGASS